jgi:hypothetical protein
VAEGLGVLFYAYIGQLVLGALIVGVVLLQKLRSPLFLESGSRTRTVWIAVAIFTLGVLVDAWFLFASNKSLELARQAAVIGVSCMFLSFAKGCGKAVLSLVCFLCRHWLPRTTELSPPRLRVRAHRDFGWRSA